MKIKLSQYTPRKVEWTIIITKISTLIINITLEDITYIYLVSYALHVMRKETSPETVLETKVALKIRHHAHTTKDDEPPIKRVK